EAGVHATAVVPELQLGLQLVLHAGVPDQLGGAGQPGRTARAVLAIVERALEVGALAQAHGDGVRLLRLGGRARAVGNRRDDGERLAPLELPVVLQGPSLLLGDARGLATALLDGLVGEPPPLRRVDLRGRLALALPVDDDVEAMTALGVAPILELG